MQSPYRIVIVCTCIFLMCAMFQAAKAQTAEPGTVASVGGSSEVAASKTTVNGGLNVFYSESGLLSVSIDGLGTHDGAGTLQVEKPAGATVRRAFLLAAAIWFNNVTNGAVSLEGNSITWDVFATAASGQPNGNAREDVTSIVKPIVDAAPAGTVNLNLVENSDLDGTILVVIFDDPNQTTPQTVALLFGAQSTTGDNFALGLADPFDPTEQSIVMSLGISFGFQGGSQYSTVEVNGARVTTSAGGQDDCEVPFAGNGCLITAGGVGDDPANPPNPNSGPTGAIPYRYDDELYTLDPFIGTGATSITVGTANPSNDDNMFFAAFNIQGTSAVIGEGILLSPSSASNPVGTSHTVTATLQNDEGNPIVNRQVDFEIVSGPNAGVTGSDMTDSNGQAQFTWSSASAGIDVVEASFIDSQGQERTSNQVTKEWTAGGAMSCADALVRVEDFDANQGSNDTQEWVRIIHDEDESVDFDGCYFAAILGRTDRSTYSVALSGIVPPSGALLVGNAAVPDVDVVIPDNTIHDKRSAIYVLTEDMPPGTRPFEVVGSVIAGISYYNEDQWYIQFPAAAATKHDGGAEALVASLAEMQAELPSAYVLEQNYPNPFNPQTTIRFELPEAGHVDLAVYDLTGRLINRLVSQAMEEGRHEVVWNGQNGAGQMMASGLYLFRIQVNGYTATRHMMLVK